jgi:hypothetical protein
MPTIPCPGCGRAIEDLPPDTDGAGSHTPLSAGSPPAPPDRQLARWLAACHAERKCRKLVADLCRSAARGSWWVMRKCRYDYPRRGHGADLELKTRPPQAGRECPHCGAPIAPPETGR